MSPRSSRSEPVGVERARARRKPLVQSRDGLARAIGLVLLSGCAPQATPDSAASLEHPKRRPDGVAIDPELSLPAAREWAHSREGVIALRTPLSHERAREAVRRFFLAVSREDLDALRQTFADGAQQLRPGSARGEEALPAWSRRFSRLDYYPLTGSIYWSDDAIEIARLRDATLDADHFGISTTLADEGGALVARATIASARVGTPLFGESLSFVLRRAGDDYLIEQLVEDFTPP
jgi:hypothetical protein